MKIAITGATGFIGRHVLRALAREPAEVVTPAFRIENAAAGLFDRMGRPDVLIHLAWGGLPNYKSAAHTDALPHHIAFLERLITEGLPSLVVTGTCLEYGMQSGRLTEAAPCAPVTPYGIAKNALLLHLMSLQRTRRFALTWARLFYTYGEGQNEQSLYSQFSTAHARGDSVFPMSGGEQLRDFMPVEAVAQAIADLAMARAEIGVVNVCSGKPVSVRSLVTGWAAARGWPVTLDLGRFPYPDYEPMEFWGDNAKLLSVSPASLRSSRATHRRAERRRSRAQAARTEFLRDRRAD